MLASLAVGELWYRKGQEKSYVSIAFGFAEVLPDRVTILARLAERAEDIDVERAEAARKRAPRSARRRPSPTSTTSARAPRYKSLPRCRSRRDRAWARVGELKRVRDRRADAPS